MALTRGTPAPRSSSAVPLRAAQDGVRSAQKSAQTIGTGRRGTLSFLFALALLPEENDSRKALLQEYLKRSKENKARNDKERLEDYYRRNYKDYFELIDGSAKGKTGEQLSETEKGIREWLQKNRR